MGSRKWLVTLIAFVAAIGFRATTANAGTVILEGSDAIGYHCGVDGPGSAACAYRDQTWSAIGGADPRKIAIIGSGTGGESTSLTHPIVQFSSIAAADAAGGTLHLNDYVALYFVATGGCCAENDGLITAAGATADVTGYLAAGGTVMIENYIGGAAWDFAVGGGGTASAHVGGCCGASLPGPTCDDGETVTADGLANGFTQPAPMSCWTHQGYQESFFNALGYTHSFFNSPVAYEADNPTLGLFSSLLSNGHTVSFSPVPEPATLVLLGTGLLGVARRRVRKNR